MIFSWDKFIRPLSGNDTNIQILDNLGIARYTINPFSVLNVAVYNNSVRVSLKSSRVISIPFSSLNEAKLALPRIKQAIDGLQSKTPIFVNNEIKNYVSSVSLDFFYQSDTPEGTGTDKITVGSSWYDIDGSMYVYTKEGDDYYWITPTGVIGPEGPIGATGDSGPIGPTGATGNNGSGFQTIYNYGQNRILTSSGSNSAIAQSNLQFDNDLLSITGGLTISGTSSMNGLTILSEVIEVINTTPSATASTVVYDFSTGINWYHSTINTDYTASFINIPTDNNRSIKLTIIINQSSTAYIPTSLQVNGLTETIKWAGGTASGTANQVDIVGFTFIRSSNTWSQVLGQINTFD